jgi:hypothetical protein
LDPRHFIGGHWSRHDRNTIKRHDYAIDPNSPPVVPQFGLMRLGGCGVIVASSLTLAACNEGNNAKPSSGTSIPSTASTTVVSKAPSSPPPGVYPSAPAPGDQASAEAAIKQGYVKKVADCYATRNAVANVVAINWNPPGFKENQGGSGVIEDAKPSLGGEFTATYVDGRWNIVYNWC